MQSTQYSVGFGLENPLQTLFAGDAPPIRSKWNAVAMREPARPPIFSDTELEGYSIFVRIQIDSGISEIEGAFAKADPKIARGVRRYLKKELPSLASVVQPYRDLLWIGSRIQASRAGGWGVGEELEAEFYEAQRVATHAYERVPVDFGQLNSGLSERIGALPKRKTAKAENGLHAICDAYASVTERLHESSQNYFPVERITIIL
jgi:hypothetical protein